MSDFKLEKVPNQKGRIAIVTGANTGLGYETALGLAKKGIKIIMACRNLDKARAAKDKILKEVPETELEVLELDLAKLKSVRQFAKTFLAKHKQLDILINNAGVMIPPYQKTEDGFELQMGVNYFGHFLLTGLLIETITQTPGSRIVTLSSNAHQNAEINFDDLQSENDYSRMGAYGQSKLACLMFALELQRRLENNGFDETISVAAHPGISNTELSRHIPKWLSVILSPVALLITHTPKSAARPTLLAALGQNVEGGNYFGPTGFREMKGDPGKAEIKPQAKNKITVTRLWEVSESLTGINYLD